MEYSLYFYIIILLFLFLMVQVYFYQKKVVQNNQQIQHIENFKNKLSSIDYKLDMSSIKNLLEDYNQLNKKSIV